MKDNNYQEALKRFKIHVSDYILIKNHIVEVDMYSDFCKLQELVDKETPMKPIITSSIPLCPKCHEETVVSTNYSMKKYGRCINEECGQRLDWSDEE